MMNKYSNLSRHALLKPIWLILLLVGTGACSKNESLPPPATGVGLWFEDLHHADNFELDADAMEVLVRYAASSLRGEPTTLELPGVLQNDRSPRIVFLDICDQHGLIAPVMGTGIGLKDALDRAVAAAKRNAVSSNFTLLRLDVVQNATTLTKLDEVLVPPSELGLFGLALPKPSEQVVAPDELTVGDLSSSDFFTLADVRRWIDTSDRRAIAPDRQGPVLPLIRFHFQSVAFDGENVRQLYRGHRLFHNPTPAELLEAARAAGRYLTRMTGESGRFQYEYHAPTGNFTDDYNFVRHAGTAYAMFELYEVWPDADLLEAADRAVNYLLPHVKPAVNENGESIPNALVLVDELQEVKLGGNALFALALAKRVKATGKNEHSETLRGLCQWMVATQAEDGEFRVHKQYHPEGTVDSFRSQYFPGEAVFALVRAFELENVSEYLNAADRAAHFQIQEQTPSDDDELPIVHDHWLLYGLSALYQHRPDPVFAQHATRICVSICDSQVGKSDYLDFNGAFAGRTEANPAATRIEGLCAAWFLMGAVGDAANQRRIEQVVQRGCEFVLQLQYRPESSIYLADPEAASGGVRDSLTKHSVRIDTVQHTISALLGTYRVKAMQSQVNGQTTADFDNNSARKP